MDAAYTMHVIEETHDAWKALVTGEKDLDSPMEAVQPAEGVASGEGGSAADGPPPVPGKIKRNLSYPKLSLEELAAM